MAVAKSLYTIATSQVCEPTCFPWLNKQLASSRNDLPGAYFHLVSCLDLPFYSSNRHHKGMQVTESLLTLNRNWYGHSWVLGTTRSFLLMELVDVTQRQDKSIHYRPWVHTAGSWRTSPVGLIILHKVLETKADSYVQLTHSHKYLYCYTIHLITEII